MRSLDKLSAAVASRSLDGTEIRHGLGEESRRWLDALGRPREVSRIALNGMIGSIAHLAYHLGAVRQIASPARGPREGTSA